MSKNHYVTDFWKKRVRESSGNLRWTSQEMTMQDVRLLNSCEVTKRMFTWADIGCGTGELQTHFLQRYSFCVGIDAEPEMSSHFLRNERNIFLESNIKNLNLDGTFDLVTAFGLITCLSAEDEILLYKKMSHLTKTGVAVVKNQCSVGKEKIVDKFSAKLESHYWARYPMLEQQKTSLESYFSKVKIEKYPDNLQEHEDTFHVAFICSHN